MNTFNHHFSEFPAFIQSVLDWHPDYIVPVAKKGCKLIKTFARRAPGLNIDEILRYRSYFQLGSALLQRRKIAVIDDATQYTATLSEYRRYFENQGAVVRTFSFVGHEELATGARPKEDHQAEIHKFLAGPVYNEYILQQSFHLLNSGCHFDLDHLVFETQLQQPDFVPLMESLERYGTVLVTPQTSRDSRITRFSLHYPDFFTHVPYFVSDDHLTLGPIAKLKFAYNAEAGTLSFSPLIFPWWNFRQSKTPDALITNVPFKLPFRMPSTVDRKDKASLQRVYTNLSFIASISLAKAFLDLARAEKFLAAPPRLMPNDLSALLGPSESSDLILSVSEYLKTPAQVAFATSAPFPIVGPKARARFPSFGAVFDHLRSGYRLALAASKSRAGAHYFLSYDALFRSYGDRVELSEQLDYFCDLGSIVPEVRIFKNFIGRACRTGEADPEPSWARTNAIIGMTTQLVTKTSKHKGVDATLLNKLLATFAFDYPREDYTELHCLVPTPYFFGSFVKAQHPLRSAIPRDLYTLATQSPYFEWDARTRQFRPKNEKLLVQNVTELFDSRQQAGYTEILNYLKFLVDISRHSAEVDVMNLLSICRDQDVFYAHLHFNLSESYAEFVAYHSYDVEKPHDALKTAAENAESGLTKCRLARAAPRILHEIQERYATNLEFSHAVHRLVANNSPFDPATFDLITQCHEILRLEMLLVHLARYHLHSHPADASKCFDFGIDEEIARRGKPGTRFDVLSSADERRDAMRGLIDHVSSRLAALPKPGETYRNRNLNAARKRASNLAVSFVREKGHKRGGFLSIDFSGLRSIPDDNAETLAHFYSLVKSSAADRGGHVLYRGDAGDDSFAYFFRDIDPALKCAEDIKNGFSENVFLNQNGYDVKFGFAWAEFTGSNPHQQVVGAWGTAKDCCEFKSIGFVNRGDLLVTARTALAIKNQSTAYGGKFVELPTARNRDGEPIHRCTAITPLR